MPQHPGTRRALSGTSNSSDSDLVRYATEMTRRFVTAVMSPVAAVAAVAAMSTATAAPASAAPAPWTDMSCGSANPLVWAPAFTWRIHAGTGGHEPKGKYGMEPALMLAGGNELPRPQSFSIGPNWYGNQVLVDWTNETTGVSGRSVSDQSALQQAPGIPINGTNTGVGTVAFTITIQTGAGWWFLNTQNAVCRGTISVLPL